MYLLNLSFFQFLAVFGSIGALSVALYLLDRSRRKQVVSTLRFWVAADQPAVAARRRHINQPWSLLLQLISMALLLLAIAQLRFGTPALAGRDHVIVLDTSAWMLARSGRGTLMDVARQRARQYLRALPARDRVMLVRADAMATPATAFEPDHNKVDAAIRASQPGSTALNLNQALSFARHVQSQDGRHAGEIAFIGPGRTAAGSAAGAAPPRNLRVISIADSVENCGLRKIGMRRAAADPSLWEIYVSAHNYGTIARTVTVSLDYGTPQAVGRVPIGVQRISLPAGGDSEASFEYRTTAAAIVGVTLTPHDVFPADDHAEIEIPAQPTLTVTVYSNEPELLRPVLASTPRVTAIFRKPAEYKPNDQGMVILDRFVPAQRPTADSLWIDPPAAGSPIPIRTSVTNVAFGGWNPAHPASAGLRTKDFKLDKVSVFETSPTDGRIGEVAAGPVIVARDGTPKIVVLGFHPALSAMRYELATPLLFANLLRWVSPDIFQRSEVSGGSVGIVKLPLEQDIPQKDIKVTNEDGSALPFTLHDRTVQFFSGTPGSVRVVAGGREYMYAMAIPEMWDSKWVPPADARQGIPHFSLVVDSTIEIWPWLAVAGAFGLLLEWILFGSFRRSLGAIPLMMRHKQESAPEVRR
ncbi:MAG TPA: VWA domain-containing protein [Candidatus Sulfopaludibacter sp.]|jgi:hypothetical protein|nr:VWA domain-containing protein [Candidatus Sulfopaludibacter sp.]